MYPPPLSNDVQTAAERWLNRGLYSRRQGWYPRGEQEGIHGVDKIDSSQRIRDGQRDHAWESGLKASNVHAGNDDELVESCGRDESSKEAEARVRKSRPRGKAKEQGAPRR